MNNVVYWIKTPDMNDVYNDGYIGVTSNLTERKKAHIKSIKIKGGNKKLKYFLKKYISSVEFVVLHKFENINECLNYENMYRPTECIGLNICAGGGYPPNNKYNKKVREKISKSLKALGVTPYSDKTHSDKSLKKSKFTKMKNKNKWYHDPITLKYKMIKTAVEKVPDGWVRGRKPKKKPLTRGLDYNCNVKPFNIFKNGKLIEKNVINLKKWSKENNKKFNTKGEFRLLAETTKIKLSFIHGKVYENGKNTNLTQKEYAVLIGKSKPTISNYIKRGFYLIKKYDYYSIVESDSASRG
jgi:predicted GIY-YIG superfamily endonuclease